MALHSMTVLPLTVRCHTRGFMYMSPFCLLGERKHVVDVIMRSSRPAG
jgi:hypothetical protein